MNFYDFMAGLVDDRDDGVGDVARDMIIDEEFPVKTESSEEIRNYFRSLLGSEDLSVFIVNLALEEAIHEWQDTLPVEHLEHHTGFVFDDKSNTVDIWWGGYEYAIEIMRLNTPSKFLTWIAHLSEKNWEGQTPYRIGRLTRALDEKLKWHIPYGC